MISGRLSSRIVQAHITAQTTNPIKSPVVSKVSERNLVIVEANGSVTIHTTANPPSRTSPSAAKRRINRAVVKLPNIKQTPATRNVKSKEKLWLRVAR